MSNRQTKTTPPLPPNAYRRLADFRLQLRKFLAFSEATARSAGVTTSQYQVMLVVAARSKPGLPIKDLAEEMLLAPNGAVQLVDRLVRLGLVRRQPSPTDGRSVLLFLTSKGSRTLRRLAVNHLEELLSHRAHLASSLEQLIRLQGPQDREGETG